MLNVSTKKRPLLLVSAAGIAALTIAGCSSSSNTQPSASPTSASPSATGNATVKFDKMIQQELADVGCYPGGVDGVIGPQTDAAIKAFQQASGLEVDGELGPETDAALKKAAQAGKTVCSQSPTSTPTPTVSPAGAKCTATSIATVLSTGETLVSYSCADGWAGGIAKKSGKNEVIFAQVEGNKWVRVPSGEICGTASAGLPISILNYCNEA